MCSNEPLNYLSNGIIIEDKQGGTQSYHQHFAVGILVNSSVVELLKKIYCNHYMTMTMTIIMTMTKKTIFLSIEIVCSFYNIKLSTKKCNARLYVTRQNMETKNLAENTGHL